VPLYPAVRPSLQGKKKHVVTIHWAGGPPKSPDLAPLYFACREQGRFTGVLYGPHTSCHRSQWSQSLSSTKTRTETSSAAQRMLRARNSGYSHVLCRDWAVSSSCWCQVWNISKDGRTGCGLPLLPHLSWNESSLTSALLHSPTSVYPASNSRNGRAMPGQIRTREDGGVRPHNTPTSRASAWWMRSPGYVPHSWACLPDQERICSVCEVHARG